MNETAAFPTAKEASPGQQALQPAEKVILLKALQGFSQPSLPRHVALGEKIRHMGPRMTKTPDHVIEVGPKTQRVRIPENGTYLQVNSVEITASEDRFVSSDIFMQFVLDNADKKYFSDEDKRALMAYTQENKLVMIRSEKPSNEFRHAFSHHTSEYNGGISFLTQANVLIDGLCGQERNKPSQDSSDAEKTSLHQLVDVANNGKSIHFSALTPDVTGEIPQNVQKALMRLNTAIKPYEFIYWTLSALSESQRRSQVEALGLLTAGLVAPVILQNGVAQFGPAVEMAVGSLAGDVLAGMMAGRGMERKKRVVEKMKVSLHSRIETIKKDTLLRHRLVALCAMVGIPLAGIGLTIATGGIAPFLLASPVVATAILGTEVHKRMSMNPKSPEEVQEVLRAYIQASPGFVRRLAKKFPHNQLLAAFSKQKSIAERFTDAFPKTTLAFYDIKRNPTAIGGWVGTVASLPAILLLNAILPNPLSLPFTIAASTMICEGGAGAIAGVPTVFRDPWKYFESELPRIQQMIQFSTQQRNGNSSNATALGQK